MRYIRSKTQTSEKTCQYQISDKFQWTNQAKNDLMIVVNASDESNRMNWSNIATKFKQKYPNFEGTDNSLRMLCQRSKTQTITNSPESSVQTKEIFRWSDKAKTDLCTIVNAAYGNDTGKINWPHIAKEFGKMYTYFKGTDNSLRMQFQRSRTQGLTTKP